MIESRQTKPQETRRLYIEKNTLISEILQALPYKKYVTEAIAAYNVEAAEAKKNADKAEYCDTGRKLTVPVMIQYFLLAAMLECRSFRELAPLGPYYGLPDADYSRLSRKSSEIPFEIIQHFCEKIYENFNRNIRRTYKKPHNHLLQILDSTRITACASKWTWAPFLKESSGMKFHTLLYPETGLPAKVLASEIRQGDTAPMMEFWDAARILVADRGYMNVKNFCEMDDQKQYFVIRLQNSVSIHALRPAEGKEPAPEGFQDNICTLGKGREIPKEYRNHEFRVVQFLGADGKMVKICTNARFLSAQEIADIYRERWGIECFFRELKQNFQIKQLFGKNQNSAFSQGFLAFIAYLLLHTVCQDMKKRTSFSGSFSQFLRMLHFNVLPACPYPKDTIYTVLLSILSP